MQDLPQPLAEQQDVVEQALRRHLGTAGASGLPLYRMMQYQLGWVNADGLEDNAGPVPLRLLGALCLEASRSVGRAAPGRGLCAAAVELLYHSVTVHEDMQIGETHADARAAVWWVWGPAQAINVGDGLHALARLALFRLKEEGIPGERVLEVVGDLDTAALRYYEGQYLELTYQERMDITEAQYVKMASTKRGALYAGAMAAGARAAGASEDLVAAFGSFGEKLGLASQIREDIDIIWGAPNRLAAGKGRLLNKSKLYPVVHALETGPVSLKRALGNIYFKRVMEPSDAEQLRSVLDETGAKAASEAKAGDHAAEAFASLEQAGISEDSVARWNTIVHFMVQRQ